MAASVFSWRGRKVLHSLGGGSSHRSVVGWPESTADPEVDGFVPPPSSESPSEDALRVVGNSKRRRRPRTESNC